MLTLVLRGLKLKTCSDGTRRWTSFSEYAPVAANAVSLTTLSAIGTSCAASSRLRAETTTSSRPRRSVES